MILWGDDYRQWNKADAVAVITKEGCVRMAHLGRRLQDSALVIDLSQLPSASPASSYHLNHSDSTLAIRAKTTAVCQNIEF